MPFQKSYWLNVTEGIDVIDLIHDVRLAVRESKLKDGHVTVYVPDGRGAILVAPEGLKEDRGFVRWLKEWTKAKGEAPKLLYLSYLFGISQTLPLVKGEVTIDLHSTIYLIDFTEEKARREVRMAIFKEGGKEEKRTCY